jgi:hypothetical protein
LHEEHPYPPLATAEHVFIDTGGEHESCLVVQGGSWGQLAGLQERQKENNSVPSTWSSVKVSNASYPNATSLPFSTATPKTQNQSYAAIFLCL